MDIYDNPSSPRVVATFEVPGVKSADMNLSIKDGCLIVQGERRDPMVHCGATASSQPSSPGDGMEIDEHVRIRTNIRELRFGRFYRAIPLPGGVEVSNILSFIITKRPSLPHRPRAVS